MESRNDLLRQREEIDLRLALLDMLEAEGQALAKLDESSEPSQPLPPLRVSKGTRKAPWRRRVVVAALAAAIILSAFSATAAANGWDILSWFTGWGDGYSTEMNGR